MRERSQLEVKVAGKDRWTKGVKGPAAWPRRGPPPNSGACAGNAEASPPVQSYEASGMSAVTSHPLHSNIRIRRGARESEMAVTNAIGARQRLHGGDLLPCSSPFSLVMGMDIGAIAALGC